MTIIALSQETIPQAMSLEFVPGGQFVSKDAHVALSDYTVALQAYHETEYPDQVFNAQRPYEHPQRVANILHSFVGDKATQGMFDATALHDIGQRIWPGNEVRGIAIRALDDYSKHSSEEDWRYTSTLLADLDKIESCSQLGRHAKRQDTGLTTLLRDRTDMLVPGSAWEASSGLVPPSKIDKLLQDVNLESVLIKAAEMLDNLRYPAQTNRAVLQDVFDAESFYAPLCEAIGYAGLAMALRSAAGVIRMQKLEKNDVLARGQDVIGRLGSGEQVLADTSGLLRHLLGTEVTATTPLTDESGHGIMLGRSSRESHKINGENVASKILWRIKSVGSLALKMSKLEAKAVTAKAAGEEVDEACLMPGDVLGMTIVVDDMKALNMVYTGLVDRIKQNTVVQERKKNAYSIQGSPDYVKEVLGNFAAVPFITQGEFEQDESRHHVAKAVFTYTPPRLGATAIPVELQIQTREHWIDSQTGSAAHLLYKAHTYEEHEILSSIGKRRLHLGAAGLNPASIDRGEQYRKYIKREALELAA